MEPSRSIKPRVIIRVNKPYLQPYYQVPLMERKIQEVDLGMPVYGFTLPHPDPDDPHTVLCGLLKRVAVETPVPDEDLLKDINDRFMPRLLEALFPDPLSLWTDFSHLEWLKKTTYELWRRNHLLDIADKMNYDMIYDYFTKNGYSQKEVEKLFKVDGFIKDECYPEPKIHVELMHVKMKVKFSLDLYLKL